MFLPLLASFVALAPPVADEPVPLARKFTMGERLAYKVSAEIRAQQRFGSLDTFIPENASFAYGYTTEVRKLKADGIVDMVYLRPTFTFHQDEDFDSAPKTTVEPVNEKILLTLSPINQILEAKDLNPKKPKPKSDGDSATGLFARRGVSVRQAQGFAEYISEVHRLALFIGSFDSGMDFNPKLPLDKVKIGDTWKQTVSYEPQKIKGDKEGKQEVQRLDYVFTYKGSMVSQGRTIQRVQASLEFSTDLGDFLKQLVTSEEDLEEVKKIQKIPLKFKGTIDFDLDPKTFRTIHADAHSEGGVQVWITDDPERAVLDENFKGETTEDLVGVGVAKA